MLDTCVGKEDDVMNKTRGMQFWKAAMRYEDGITECDAIFIYCKGGVLSVLSPQSVFHSP